MTESLASKPVPVRSKWLVALGAVITAAFCGFFVLGLLESRNRDRDEARRAGENIVASMASEIERNLELYGLSLEAVVDGLNLSDIATMRPELRQRVLFDRASTAKDLGSILVLDHHGTLTHDSRIVAPMPEDHSARDYFTAHKDNPHAGLYISQPWRAIDGHYVAISRVRSDISGRFAGVVVGTLKLTYFERIFGALKLGPGDRITLVHNDGTLIMRAPVGSEFTGRHLAGSPLFARIAALTAGSFEDIGQIDGVERLFVFQRVGGYPLILSYNRATADIYAGWHNKAWQFGAIIVALCAINILLLAFLIRALRLRSDAENRMAAIARTDSLTGLANRRALDEAFTREWRRAMRARSPVALLMIDADHFKVYNDAFGHQAGDTALTALANCIQQSARRAVETCARYGGEEFAVLLPGLSTEEAAARAEVIRTEVHALRAAQTGRPDSTPTVSIGIASMVPRVGLEPRDLVSAADAALYDAKEKGRDRIGCMPRFAAIVDRTRAA